MDRELEQALRHYRAEPQNEVCETAYILAALRSGLPDDSIIAAKHRVFAVKQGLPSCYFDRIIALTSQAIANSIFDPEHLFLIINKDQPQEYLRWVLGHHPEEGDIIYDFNPAFADDPASVWGNHVHLSSYSQELGPHQLNYVLDPYLNSGVLPAFMEVAESWKGAILGEFDA